MRVTGPGGRRWWVGRRWLPWQPRMRAWGEPSGYAGTIAIDDLFALVVVLERGDDTDRHAIGDCVVARFTGADGRQYGIAVTPRHRAGLQALLDPCV